MRNLIGSDVVVVIDDGMGEVTEATAYPPAVPLALDLYDDIAAAYGVAGLCGIPSHRYPSGIPAIFIANIFHAEVERRERRHNLTIGEHEVDNFWLSMAIEKNSPWVFPVASGAESTGLVGYLPLAPAMLRIALRKAPGAAEIPASIWGVDGRRHSVDIRPAIINILSRMGRSWASLTEVVREVDRLVVPVGNGLVTLPEPCPSGFVVALPISIH